MVEPVGVRVPAVAAAIDGAAEVGRCCVQGPAGRGRAGAESEREGPCAAKGCGGGRGGSAAARGATPATVAGRAGGAAGRKAAGRRRIGGSGSRPVTGARVGAAARRRERAGPRGRPVAPVRPTRRGARAVEVVQTVGALVGPRAPLAIPRDGAGAAGMKAVAPTPVREATGKARDAKVPVAEFAATLRVATDRNNFCGSWTSRT